MTQAAPELGATLTGGYQLTRFLGQGAMGAVYEALTSNGQRVAIKVVLLEGNEQHAASLLARFEREAQLVQAIDSPFVVKALHVGVDEETRMPFMVMPLMAGLDVEELIHRDGALHPTVVVRLGLQAAYALQAAHGEGIVHRDMKPGNMFLDHDRQGRVTLRVLDFGLGKIAGDDQGLTKTGSVFGTPQYMAPEQFKDAKRVDPRADLWGLGASLYHMVSGVGPFEHCTDMSQLVVSVCRDDPRPLQDVAPWVDPGLAMLIHGLLLRDPDARCPSAQELVRALHNFAAGSHEVWQSWLAPLDEDIRAHSAQPAAIPTSWQVAAPQRSVPALREEDDIIGRRVGSGYTLLRRIGSGGMGAVYEAEGPDGGRYAVKVVRTDRAGASKSLLRRFVREANATQALDSPHVVRVIEAGNDDDLPFIVMELMAGEDLSDTIARLGPLEPRHAARIIVQACEGLEAAHRQGIVHRDVKPANLFVHELPSRERIIKLCDFGIAKDVTGDNQQTSLTQTGGMLGSPMYMSPEQIKDAKSADLRTDIWSLGATLYHALTGSAPWSGSDTVGALILAIHTDPLPDLTRVAPWVNPQLAAVVRKAMTRDVNQRFGSMAEMAEAVKPFVGETTALRNGIAAASAQTRERRHVATPTPTDPTVASTDHAEPVAVGPTGSSSPAVGAASTAGGTSLTADSSPPARSRLGPALIAAALTIAVAGAGALALSDGSDDSLGSSGEGGTASDVAVTASADAEDASDETASEQASAAPIAEEPEPSPSTTASSEVLVPKPPTVVPPVVVPPVPVTTPPVVTPPPAPPPPPPPPPAAPPPKPGGLEATDEWG